MAVNITEQYIPGGFNIESAKKLGYAVEAYDQGYNDETPCVILISFAGENICLDPKLLYGADKSEENNNIFENTYVAFVNRSCQGLSDNICNYAWEIKLLNRLGEKVINIPEIPEVITEDGIFSFGIKCKDIKNTYNEISTVSITLTLLDKNKVPLIIEGNHPLEITHIVTPLNATIEKYIHFNNIGNGPKESVNAFTLRLIANNFIPWIKNCENILEKSKIPINIIISIVINRVFKLHNSFLREEGDDLLDWINEPNKKIHFDLFRNRGICGSSFLTASMLLKPDGIMDMENPIWSKKTIPVYNNRYDKSTEKDFIDFIKKDKNVAAIIYNLLRFPKSNIECCAYLLSLLKTAEYDGSYPWKDIKLTKDIEKSILSQLFTGFYEKTKKIPHDAIGEEISKSVNSQANLILSSLYDKYPVGDIENIIGTYKTITLSLLDIRSWEPIAFAKVKGIEVFAGDSAQNCKPKIYVKRVDEREIYDKNELYITESLVTRAAQNALLKMGYFKDENGKSISYSNGKKKLCTNKCDEKTKDAIELYCKERGITIDTDKEILTNKLLHYFIKDEFNNQWCTDHQGVINIRLPQKVADSKYIRIDIGFWDFPIIVEGRVWRCNTDKVETNFKIDWTGGDDASKQCIDWKETLENNKNFGWKVTSETKWRNGDGILNTFEDNLKVSQSIIIKENGNEKEYDYVLFGMEWANPLYDGIIDSDIKMGGWRSSKDSFLNKLNTNNNWIGNHYLHIVTSWSGKFSKFGHFYGFNGIYRAKYVEEKDEWIPKGHSGIDLFGCEGDFCFAYHGGTVEVGKPDGCKKAGGRTCLIKNYKYPNSCLQYLHLQDNEYNELHEKHVYAGQVVGQVGRTGNIDCSKGKPTVSIYPTHLHLNLGKIKNVWDSFKNMLAISEPNDFPLLLPCKCKYHQKQPESNVATNCFFSKDNIYSSCWAVQEFPYDDTQMNESSNNKNIDWPSEPKQISSNPNDNTAPCVFICPYIHRRITFALHNNITKGDGDIVSDINIQDFPSNGFLLIGIDTSNEETVKIASVDTPSNTIDNISISIIDGVKYPHSVGEQALFFSNQLIQAQLKFVYERDMDKDNCYFQDPGKVNGKIDEIKQVEFSKPENNRIKIVVGSEKYGFCKIEGKNKTGWIDKFLLSDFNGENNTAILESVVTSLVDGVSQTRSAIYFYNKSLNQGQVDLTNYAKNFEVDSQLVKSLSEAMPINPCWNEKKVSSPNA